MVCYLQGPAVAQHYSVSIATGLRAPSLDINAYVKQTYDRISLWKHLNGHGNCSKRTLINIITPCPGIAPLIPCTDAETILKHLKEKFVGLVSEFRVYSEFKERRRFHYHGLPVADIENEDALNDTDKYHAMAVVGNNNII